MVCVVRDDCVAVQAQRGQLVQQLADLMIHPAHRSV